MNWEIRTIQVKKVVSVFHALEFIGVKLRSGHHTQQIVCPFHDDTKPSARVYEDTGKLYCFKCQKLWDSIALVQQYLKVDSTRAIEVLEQAFGIDPNKIDLTLALQHNLTKAEDSSSSSYYLYQHVESQLIEARFKMGLEKYCKALNALDQMHFYLKSGQLTSDKFKMAAMKILDYI